MSPTVTIDEAQAKLKDLVHELAPGEEVVITENQQPMTKLVGEQSKAVWPNASSGRSRRTCSGSGTSPPSRS
jgi:antitoxin (DNA-binding transcriptional repressor) of toxin-antitoxin stability system